MKINFFIGIGLAITFLFSCSQSTKKKDLIKDHLNGKVVLTYATEVEGDHIGQIIEYNEDGMITKDFLFFPDDNEYQKKENFYNEGLLKKSNVEALVNEIKKGFVKDFYYDSDNRLSKIVSSSSEKNKNSTFIYFYENGKIKEVKSNGGEISSQLFFYSTNQLDSTITKESTISSNYLDKITVNYLNKLEQVTKQVIIEDKTNKTLFKFKYNEYGNLSSAEYERNNVKGQILYEYKYDSQNNWIEKVKIDKLSGIKNIFIRKIYYEGDLIGTIPKTIFEYKMLLSKNETTNSENSQLDSNKIQNHQNDVSVNQYTNSANSSQSQNIQQEKCYKCRGTGVCTQCSKTFSKQYYKGNGSYENRNETRPGLLMCNDCRGRGHKQTKRIEGGWEPGEDCYVSRCDNGWVLCRECNYNGDSKSPGQCKECKGTGYRN